MLVLVTAALALRVGPHTFSGPHIPLNQSLRTRRSNEEVGWSILWASEGASQMATYLQVVSSDFPGLYWSSLPAGILGAYYIQEHEIRMNRYYYNDYMREPGVLRLVLLHELLHAFGFGGPGNATARAQQWQLDFDTADPGVQGGHWITAASSGYHVRTRLHAQAELMQPVLDGMSHLTMASLVGTDKQVRYACERDTDCSGARKFCVHENNQWVGVCSLHRASDQDHGVVVLSIVIVLVVLLATITAVVFIPAS